jgi:hypothetical protein
LLNKNVIYDLRLDADVETQNFASLHRLRAAKTQKSLAEKAFQSLFRKG